MKKSIICGVLSASLWAPCAAAESENDPRPSVVKIHAVRRPPSLTRPWTLLSARTSKGSGVVLSDGRVLTNAHVVGHASEIEIQPFQSARKFAAKLVAEAPGIDLAVLKVQDSDFAEKYPPLPFADALPAIRDTVTAFGYPTGGSDLSVTEGIVSRIEFTFYYHGVRGLRIQVDAALNPGNSGGPATTSDGRVVGLVFSRISQAENIGYLIPVEEINRFLDDVSDGRYDGKPEAPVIYTQRIDNDALRQRLGIGGDVEGIMVTSAHSTVIDQPLRTWDVITHIGPHPIDRAGDVRLRDDLRANFRYYVPHLASDDVIELTVIRDAKPMTVRLPVENELDFLIKPLGNSPSRYFIYGPITLGAVTREYVSLVSSKNAASMAARGSPMVTRQASPCRFPGEELVVFVSGMLPHPITKGYSSHSAGVVTRINQVEIRNLRHAIETLGDLKDEFVTFEFADHGYDTLVFRRREIEAATEKILEDNGIRRRGSPDLIDLWNQRSGR